ncbi:hypothetical protein [Alienimonas sp. DA493]|uniref:hypothetical protein n=1 Tax=Alienimonas sp. DA493 TaxID=3373605 RepID=UPI003754A903
MSSRRFAPRLTRGEYWILNSLVEAKVPLAFYRGSDQDFFDLFNRPSHGLTKDELVLTLLGLFNAGWIVGRAEHEPFEYESDRDRPPPSYPFTPTGEAIRRVLNVAPVDLNPGARSPDPCVHIGLTAEGGGVWEAFAAPRWERFLQQIGAWGDTTLRVVRKEHGQQYARCWAEVDQYDPDALVWKPVAPFRATYWKTLPIGFETRFRANRRFVRRGMSQEEAAEIRTLDDCAMRSSHHLRWWWAWE